MIEVELKFKIAPTALPELEKYLKQMRFVRRVQNSDIYYDTPSFALLRQAVFARIRNQKHLEFKFNEQALPEHISCTERVFSLLPEAQQEREMNMLFSGFLPEWKYANTVEQGLLQNNMVELAKIENNRIEYTYEDLFIYSDQVEGLGNFLEIEMQCEEGSDTHQAARQLEQFAMIIRSQRVHIGYVELWLQKYNPGAYRLGKYQEEFAGKVEP